MQALCKVSDTASDVRCSICGQGFLVYWSRTSRSEQEATYRGLIEALELHHTSTLSAQAHPRSGFNVPEWSGLAQFSGAALLGGAENWSL